MPLVGFPHLGSIMNDAWFILLFGCTLTPLLVAFDPSYLMKVISRASLKKKVAEGKANSITQEQAHAIYEDPNFDVTSAYVMLCKPFFTLVFFQPILPIGVFTGLLAFITLYYAYKIKLIRFSKRPIQISGNIGEVSLYLLNWIPFVSGVS